MLTKPVKTILVIIILLSIGFPLQAQLLPCKDTLAIAPYYPCFADYDPVCGCDGITYRNACYAQNRAGLNHFQSGVCGNFDFDVLPNLIRSDFIFSIYINEISNGLISIFDIYGLLKYQRPVNYVNKDSFTINVNNFEDGVYIIMVTVKGESQVKKFMKVQ